MGTLTSNAPTIGKQARMLQTSNAPENRPKKISAPQKVSLEKFEQEQAHLQGPHQLPKGVNQFGAGDRSQPNLNRFDSNPSYKRRLPAEVTPEYKSTDLNYQNYDSNDFNTGPPRIGQPENPQAPLVRPGPSVSDPHQSRRRNPLEVNVNPKRKFEAVDPFASNNPYSRLTSRAAETRAIVSRTVEAAPENGVERANVRLLRRPVEAVGRDQGEAGRL